MPEDLKNHPAFLTPIAGDADTAVIACHFNPCGYARPVANLRDFLDGMAAQGVPLHMVELTFADQVPVLPENSPRVRQLRTSRENLLWQKEGLLNALAARLPAQFTKIAWVDADVLFSDMDWLSQASAVLDQSPIVQLFTRCLLTGPGGEAERMKPSVGWASERGHPHRADWGWFHPGFAWAARREFFSSAEHGGGLFPCVLGGGDSVTALGAIGRLSRAQAHCGKYSPGLYAAALASATALTAWTGGRARALPGDLTHLWHGSREDRQYSAKYDWLREYDPAAHLALDPATGIASWSDEARARLPHMVAAVAHYFVLRREDGLGGV